MGYRNHCMVLVNTTRCLVTHFGIPINHASQLFGHVTCLGMCVTRQVVLADIILFDNTKYGATHILLYWQLLTHMKLRIPLQ